MMASPPVMASLTVAVEMFESSSQMEMVPLLAASSVVAAAKEAGVPVPYHEMAVALVHAMEERKQWK